MDHKTLLLRVLHNVIAVEHPRFQQRREQIRHQKEYQEEKAKEKDSWEKVEIKIGQEGDPLKKVSPYLLKKITPFKKHRIQVLKDKDHYFEFWYQPEEKSYTYDPPMGHVSGDDKFKYDIKKMARKAFDTTEKIRKKLFRDADVPGLNKA